MVEQAASRERWGCIRMMLIDPKGDKCKSNKRCFPAV